MRYRVGIDIGGTFTDVILIGADGSQQSRKVLSTPDDYGRGIVAGLSQALTAALDQAAARIKSLP